MGISRGMLLPVVTPAIQENIKSHTINLKKRYKMEPNCRNCRFKHDDMLDDYVFCEHFETEFPYPTLCEHWQPENSDIALYVDRTRLGDTSPKEDTPQDEYYPDFKWVE